MALTVETLDPFDDGAAKAWYEVYRAAEVQGREFHTAWAYDELVATMRTPDSGHERIDLAAMRDDDVVGIATVEVPLRANRELLYGEVGVRPDLWGRGVGSTLLAHVEELARERGRSTVVGEVAFPYDGPEDGSGTRAAGFARHHGYRLALSEVQRVLDLPVPKERLDALAAQAAPRHEGYTFRQVRDPVPAGLRLAVGRMRALVDVESPTGDLPLELDPVDEERLREVEARLVAQGRTRLTTVALAPDGTPAGYTEYVVPAHDPPWVYQWGTLVLREHRGHSLGLALKVRNTAWLQREFPERRGVRTWNAGSNRHMVAVNDALGFRPVEHSAQFLKEL